MASRRSRREGVRGDDSPQRHNAAKPQPNARSRRRARMRHGKLLQPEEGCQLTCDGISLAFSQILEICEKARLRDKSKKERNFCWLLMQS
jgi:hypothetical protein